MKKTIVLISLLCAVVSTETRLLKDGKFYSRERWRSEKVDVLEALTLYRQFYQAEQMGPMRGEVYDGIASYIHYWIDCGQYDKPK